MSEELTALTKEAIALPYEEQKELLNALNVSVSLLEKKTRKRTHEENTELVKSFMGMSNCWQNTDILEYQRKLRGEYNG